MSDAEVEQLSLIRCIVGVPQASPAQEQAFDRLVAMILPELDRYARRPYLPDDEADAALDGIHDAVRLVTTAKQRLERAVRRLREIETADPTIRRQLPWHMGPPA